MSFFFNFFRNFVECDFGRKNEKNVENNNHKEFIHFHYNMVE